MLSEVLTHVYLRGFVTERPVSYRYGSVFLCSVILISFLFSVYPVISSALSASSLCLSIPLFSVSIVSRYTAFLLLLLLFFRRQVPADRLHRFLSLLSQPLFLKQLLFVRSYHYWLIKKTSLLLLLWLLPPLLFLAVMASIQTLSSAQRNTHRLSTNMISG